MALISTLRTRMTKFVVGIVALALGAFILGGDFFGNSSTALFGGPDNRLGEIDGHSISLEEFQAAVQERENNYIMNFGRQPGEREQSFLRQQAWDMLIVRNAISPQYEKVGIEVTSDEVWDMLQGKNVDENIKLSFTDSTGNFDRSRFINYLQQIEAMPPSSEGRIRWEMFRRDILPARERIKYENLILKTNYVTEAEAEFRYHTDNDVVEVKYLYVPYYSIRDSAVQVTDADLKKYYDKNKTKYKTEEKRSLSYVTFSLTPTAADSLSIREELAKLTEDLKNTNEDSTIANINSDGGNAFMKYNVSSLPSFLNDQISTLSPGAVYGPFLDGNRYKVMKVSKIGKDTTYQMRANHILIKWDDESDASKKAAKEKARKILNDIKGGASFAAKAREFGTDGTAPRGGDLGWFPTGQMVKPFEKAVMAASQPGLLNDVVETQFGYHIIEVTEVKNNSTYTIASIEREITPGDETQDEAFRKADAFTTDLSGTSDFNAKATQEKIPVMEANNLGTTDQRVGNLGEARQIITWLFRDASVGKVSTVFSLDGNYVVAVMTAETEKGYQPFEKVKEEITPIVRNELKAKQAIAKLSGEGTLESLSEPFGSDAVVGTSSDLKMNTGTIQNIGFDPIAVGKAFALEEGKRSKPFAGENGVVVMEVIHKTIAPSMGDFSLFKNQVMQNVSSSINGATLVEAIKERADILDQRYKFY